MSFLPQRMNSDKFVLPLKFSSVACFNENLQNQMRRCWKVLSVYIFIYEILTFPAENPDAQDPPSHLHPEEVHLWWDRFLCLEIVFTFEFPRQTHIGQTREVFPEEQHGFGANWTPWLHVTGQPRRSCTAIFFSAPRQLSPTGLLMVLSTSTLSNRKRNSLERGG